MPLPPPVAQDPPVPSDRDNRLHRPAVAEAGTPATLLLLVGALGPRGGGGGAGGEVRGGVVGVASGRLGEAHSRWVVEVVLRLHQAMVSAQT